MRIEPQWTERAEKRGLDPLGQQNSGIALYQTLLPGISNVTPRLRYFGYYCWVSDTYARRSGSTNFEEWRRWIRRSEAVLALVSAHIGGETAIGGIDWATNALRSATDVIDFTEAAEIDSGRPYLRQQMGIFGGAYVSQLLETGLFSLSDQHSLAMASAKTGRPLAQAFRDSIGEAEPLLIEAIETGVTSLSHLAALQAILPSRIDPGSAEAGLYREMLVGNEQSENERDRSRRESLRLSLFVADAIGKRPTSDDVRWSLFDPTSPVPADLEDRRLAWETYHTQDLFQLASAGLFAWALNELASPAYGKSYDEIAEDLRMALTEQSDRFSSIAWDDYTTEQHASLQDIRAWADLLTSRRTLATDLLEPAIRLIAAMANRVDSRADLRAAVETRFQLAPTVRSVRSELQWLQSRAKQSVPDVIADYLVQRILKRHAEVAMRKLRYQRDYTFHFEANEGRLTRRFSYEPVMTSPRLGSALQILADLQLLDQGGATAIGKALMVGPNDAA